MSTRLITGLIGAGLRTAVREHIASARRDNPFARILLLVANQAQAAGWRRELAAAGMATGLHILTFYPLYDHILEAAGRPIRSIHDAARLHLLSGLLRRAQAEGELDHFAAIGESAGFRRALASLLFELKQSRVDPVRFTTATLDYPAKFRELAHLYEAYQRFLIEHDLADAEGRGWQALGALDEDLSLCCFDLLVVDGFDQFNPLQADLLSALAERSQESWITLAAGPGPAYARYDLTAAQLRNHFWQAGYDLHTHHLPPEPLPPWRMALATQLFAPEAPAVNLPDPAPVEYIEAPDRLREVRAVARAIRQRLHTGEAAEGIAVLTYDLQLWAPLIREVFEEFGLPFHLTMGERLEQAPPVVALLRALDLWEQRFPRRLLNDLWQSPYLRPVPLTREGAAQVALIGAQAQLSEGREAWLRALQPTPAPYDPDSEPSPDDLLVNQMAPEHLATLRAELSTFFERLTPPAEGTTRQLARWVEGLIGDDPAALARDEGGADLGEGLELMAHLRRLEAEAATPEAQARIATDLEAVSAFKRLLRDYVAGAEMVGSQNIAWERFRMELGRLVGASRLQPEAAGGVLVSDIFAARGLSHRHRFLLGLNEGEFPPSESPDPLLTLEEREALAAEEVLQEAHRDARDRAAWLEATGWATEGLTLSRSYLDSRGNPWPASPFWGEVQRLVAGRVQRLPIAAEPSLSEVAAPTEWLVAAAQALHRAEPGPYATHHALLADPALEAVWQHAIRTAALEAARERLGPEAARYQGHLTDARLLAETQQRLQNRRWSATSFNDLGVCGFRFFARRLVDVAPPASALGSEGAEAIHLGLVQHEILEDLFRALAAQGGAITPATLTDVLTLLDEVATPRIASAPQRLRFRRTALWDYQAAAILQRLRRLVRREAAENEALGEAMMPRPAAIELAFGYDEASPPLHLRAPWGDMQVQGRIDRIDRFPDGSLRLTDYKSGSRPIPTREMTSGRNVQMAIYLHAAEAHYGAEGSSVREARFLHLSDGSTSGHLRAPGDDIPTLLAEADSALTRRLAEAHAGHFHPHPDRPEDGRCVHYCEYAALCRAQGR